jgi:hypothetical protein
LLINSAHNEFRHNIIAKKQKNEFKVLLKKRRGSWCDYYDDDKGEHLAHAYSHKITQVFYFLNPYIRYHMNYL